MLLTIREAAERLSPEQAADYLGISKSTLRNLRYAGKIGFMQPSPRRIYYTRQQLDEYLESVTRSPVPVGEASEQETATCTDARKPASITSISQARAERELDALLAPRTAS